MEAALMVLVMHCGVPEALVRATPDSLSVRLVEVVDRKTILENYLPLHEALPEQFGILKVEDSSGEKCAVST